MLRMKMRDLELRTGVGRETIRFYIRQGLLPEPERRARNVAVYGDVHASRLKAIKRLQEERFLPLDVIKRVLDGDLSALPPAASGFEGLGEMLAGRLGLAEGDGAVAVETLTAGDPATAADIAAFEAMGIVTVRLVGRRRVLNALDARIVTLWRDVRRAGYRPDAFPPDFARIYADAAQKVAEVEVARFYDGLEGRIDRDDAAAMAEQAIGSLNTLIGTLRIRAILGEVAKRAEKPVPARAAARG